MSKATKEQREQWRQTEVRKKAEAEAAKIAAANPMFAKLIELEQAAQELKGLREYGIGLQQRVDQLGREFADFLAALPKGTV